jgi:hypothetical protein
VKPNPSGRRCLSLPHRHGRTLRDFAPQPAPPKGRSPHGTIYAAHSLTGLPPPSAADGARAGTHALLCSRARAHEDEIVYHSRLERGHGSVARRIARQGRKHPRSLDLCEGADPGAGRKLPGVARNPGRGSKLHREATGEDRLRRDDRQYHHAGDTGRIREHGCRQLPVLPAQVPAGGRNTAAAAGRLRDTHGWPPRPTLALYPRREPVRRADHDDGAGCVDHHGPRQLDHHDHGREHGLSFREWAVHRVVRGGLELSRRGRDWLVRVSERVLWQRGCPAVRWCVSVTRPGLCDHGHQLRLHLDPMTRR